MGAFSWDTGCPNKTAVALGYFDGVHIGHARVIGSAVSEARERGWLSAVFSFTDKSGLCKKKADTGEIYDDMHRCTIFGEIGADYVIMPDFTDFYTMSPEQFVAILAERFSAGVLCCGEDFRFGYQGRADVRDLKRLAEKAGCEVIVVNKVELFGATVSSTRIRAALRDGDMPTARALLGRPYGIRANVVSGKHIGKAELYPTINQKFTPGVIIPKRGVYASEVLIDGEKMCSVTDIGVCPTVGGTAIPAAETHIIDADIDMYGKTVEVLLNKFLREEKKFESTDKLKTQIAADIEEAKKNSGR